MRNSPSRIPGGKHTQGKEAVYFTQQFDTKELPHKGAEVAQHSTPLNSVSIGPGFPATSLLWVHALSSRQPLSCLIYDKLANQLKGIFDRPAMPRSRPLSFGLWLWFINSRLNRRLRDIVALLGHWRTSTASSSPPILCLGLPPIFACPVCPSPPKKLAHRRMQGCWQA